MKFQFTHPQYLLLLPVVLGWFIWLWRTSDVHINPVRRWISLGLRLLVGTAIVLALAGMRWMRPLEGMNVYYLLDRSDSVPSARQEAALQYVNRSARQKDAHDKAGVIVFGSEASIESSPNSAVDVQKIQAVVGTDRTDIGAAVQLGTAAFPETGQKRLVLISDGNENLGDALNAVLSAKPLGVSVDVVPVGSARRSDVSVQRLQVPSNLKSGQPFEAKIFVQAEQTGSASVRLFRNQEFLGEQKVELSAGKNLFSFPQHLTAPGYYSYDVQLDVSGDPIPQNNRASGFANVRGDPRVLIVSADPAQDRALVTALEAAGLRCSVMNANEFPTGLAAMQAFDTIFISNLAAGDLGPDRLKLLESAVRDFGVGLVCVGGDQAYAAGSYRGTPLEAALPVSMELDSKKVLPSGAVALVMHGMEFNNGNQVARDCAQGVLNALGPGDELGVLLWDGSERWLFPLTRVGDKKDLARQIAGMNQGDLGSFQNILGMAHEALKKSTANLKHVIVFSDGDPGPPSQELMEAMVADRITVSTILISGHVGPETMIWIAEHGKGRFYNVTSPGELPQIFIKEAAVILKSAIYEEPFKPQVRSVSEVVRGIRAEAYPVLRGYVATSSKPRAETPLWTEKGDPLLAHWQYGLGRAVAFTSDAKPKWARDWMGWERYRQFWSQVAQWSLRRVENAEFATEVTMDKGQGLLSVDATDAQGNYRNFLNLQTVVVSPKGERQRLRLEQTGPGHYEARFDTREPGTYMLNLMDIAGGQPRAFQVVGASVNYSPEFNATEPNLALLRRLVESGGGKVLDFNTPEDDPFSHDRKRTYQPRDIWEWLLRAAIVLFVLDVGVRRVQIEAEDWQRGVAFVRRKVFFWKHEAKPSKRDESLAALLARRDAVRAQTTQAREQSRGEAPVLVESFVSVPATPVDVVRTEKKESAEASAPAVDQGSLSSRLLEARKRAKKK